jgi:hypothetical protein
MSALDDLVMPLQVDLSAEIIPFSLRPRPFSGLRPRSPFVKSFNSAIVTGNLFQVGMPLNDADSYHFEWQYAFQ